jgi:HK97 family phage prohead protease
MKITNTIVRAYAATYTAPELRKLLKEAMAKLNTGSVITVASTGSGTGYTRTLTLTPDDHGLKVRADLGGTELGAEIWNEVEGRYSTKMSMGFIVRADERIVEENKETGTVKVTRRILDISRLFDVSIVSYPANDHTSIATRSYCEGVIAEVREEFRQAKRERQKQRIRILMEATK